MVQEPTQERVAWVLPMAVRVQALVVERVVAGVSKSISQDSPVCLLDVVPRSAKVAVGPEAMTHPHQSHDWHALV
jgi:hypothetical protein